jgi:hypothetical protein
MLAVVTNQRQQVKGRETMTNLDGGVEGKVRVGRSDILHEGEGWYH